MEKNKKISDRDSIIASKILVQEAYRINPKIKETHSHIINHIFESYSDPQVIRAMLSRARIFA